MMVNSQNTIILTLWQKVLMMVNSQNTIILTLWQKVLMMNVNSQNTSSFPNTVAKSANDGEFSKY